VGVEISQDESAWAIVKVIKDLLDWDLPDWDLLDWDLTVVGIF
jgi:hypothetical protein